MAGIGAPLTAALAALDAVAVKQRFRVRQSAPDQRQLPGEIDGILHAGVHPLSTRRAVDMGGVADKKHAAGTIIGHLALIDDKAGQPDWGRCRYAAGPPAVE